MLQHFDHVFCPVSSSASTNTVSAVNLARAWEKTQANKNPGVIHIFEVLMDLKREDNLR